MPQNWFVSAHLVVIHATCLIFNIKMRDEILVATHKNQVKLWSGWCDWMTNVYLSIVRKRAPPISSLIRFNQFSWMCLGLESQIIDFPVLWITTLFIICSKPLQTNAWCQLISFYFYMTIRGPKRRVCVHVHILERSRSNRIQKLPAPNVNSTE